MGVMPWAAFQDAHGSGIGLITSGTGATYLRCFCLVLERCDPNIRGRGNDGGQFG